MDRVLSDLRFALRVLRRSPGFSLTALIVLALGIGATTAVYALVDAAMLRPFPYKDMDRIMVITERSLEGETISVSWPNFQDWRAQATVFEELGVYRGAAVTLTGDGPAERLTGAMVSSSVFTTMGVPPLRGRVFNEEDDKPGDGRVVILSERVWRNRFGGAEDIVGRQISFSGTPFTVVGIMPPAMRFPARTTDVWVPLGGSIRTFPASRGAHPGLTVIGRLKRGVTFERARAEMETIGERLAQQYPDANGTNRPAISPYYESIVGDIRPTLYALLAAVGLLLLIACANLAGLMIARAEQRQRELVVRAALGAGRARIVRQLLAEACILGIAGGAAGLLLAWIALRAFVASEPTSIPRIDMLGIDWRVASFAMIVSLATIGLFGLLPAIRAASPDLRGALQHLRAGAGRHSVRVRRLVVSAQMAIAVLLLIGAGLLGRTMTSLMAVDLGFKPENVISGRISLPPNAYPTLEAWTQFHQHLAERLRALPGVTAVGLNTSVPLEGGASESSIRKEGDPPPSAAAAPTMSLFQSASPAYFEAMGIQLVRGRVFDERDRDGAIPVAVVDETLAARMFPDRDALGKRVSFEGIPPAVPGDRPGEVWREIVGIVRHVKHYGIVSNRPYVQIYTPYTQLPIYWRERRPSMGIFVRTSADPEASLASIRQAIGSMDSRLPLFGVRTMEQYVAGATEQPRLSAALLIGFAMVALILALVGIYGVLAYSVSQRTREIGVRMALGAGRGQIIRDVLWEGSKLSLIGLAVGLALAIPAGRYIESLLFNVKPGDAATFGVAAAILFVTALAATWLPARRASTVQPVVALRGD